MLNVLKPWHLLLMTTVAGLWISGAIFINFGVALSYNPSPTRSDELKLLWGSVSLLPVIFLLTGNCVENKIRTFFLGLASLSGIGFAGAGVLSSSNLGGFDAVCFLLIPIGYCFLIITSAIIISRN